MRSKKKVRQVIKKSEDRPKTTTKIIGKPFQIENELWKKRNKHGRNPLFTDPKMLQEACYKYFEYQSQQVWIKVDFRGKDARRIEIPTPMPFTIQGLCIFLGVNSEYFNDFQAKLKKDQTEKGRELLNVIYHIMDVIFVQKLQGAIVGAYNPLIVARQLGLTDKKDLTTNGDKLEAVQIFIPDNNRK